MKSHTLEPTKDADLFRVVDREGNWTHYYHLPTKRYLKSITHILGTGFPKGERFHQYLLSKTKDEADKILRAAGERGDRIHKAISTIVLGNGYVKRDELLVPSNDAGGLTQLNDDEWDVILSFADFWNTHEPVVYLSEFPAYNLDHGFAGTGDLVWMLTKPCGVRACMCAGFVGKIGICDVKTGSGPYEWWVSQLAAYERGVNVPDLLAGKEIGYAVNLRIGTKSERGWQTTFYAGRQMDDGFLLLLSSKILCEACTRPFSDKDIIEIPDVVILKQQSKPRKKPRKKKISLKNNKRGRKK